MFNFGKCIERLCSIYEKTGAIFGVQWRGGGVRYQKSIFLKHSETVLFQSFSIYKIASVILGVRYKGGSKVTKEYDERVSFKNIQKQYYSERF